MEIVPTKSGSKKSSLPSFEEANEVVASWLPDQETFFIDILKDMVIKKGDTRVTTSFTKTEWLEIRKRYYSKWGLKYELKAFKNKYQLLRDRFKEFKLLIENSSGAGWHPVLVTLDVTENWWEEYAKTHPKAKNVKRFRSLGCLEYKSLEVIFADTIATGHLQASANHEFNSTDEENTQNEATAESPSVAGFNSVGGASDHDKNDQTSQSKGPARSRKRGRGSDLSEAVMMLAEASNAKAESRRKFTITECIDVVEAMNVNIGRKAYGKLMSLIENKVWREGFLHMPDARKKDILQSIEEGDL